MMQTQSESGRANAFFWPDLALLLVTLVLLQLKHSVDAFTTRSSDRWIPEPGPRKVGFRAANNAAPESDSIDWVSVGTIGSFGVGEREEWAEELQAWCEVSGFFNPGSPPVRIKNIANGKGFGLIATKNIDQDEVLICVPEDKALTSDSIPDCMKGKIDESLMVPAVKLALNIIYEESKGEDSDFDAFLSALPRGHGDLPAFWAPRQLAWLAGTLVEADVRALRRRLEAEYAALAPAVAAGMGLPNFGLADWAWARAAALSRAYFVGDSYRLCPLVDFANHDDGVEYAVLGGDGVFAAKEATVLVADKAVKKGEEVHSSYGSPLANWRKLYSFGHTSTGKAPLDGAFELQLKLSEEDAAFELKQKFLKRAQQAKTPGLAQNVFFEIFLTKETRGPLVTQGADLKKGGPGAMEVKEFLRQALPVARLAVLSPEDTALLLGGGSGEEAAEEGNQQGDPAKEEAERLDAVARALSEPVRPEGGAGGDAGEAYERRARKRVVDALIAKMNRVTETFQGIPKLPPSGGGGGGGKEGKKQQPQYGVRERHCVNVCAGEIYALQIVISTMLKL